MNHFSFSQILLSQNLVTQVQLQSALQLQAETGENLGSILYNRRILTEEQVLRALSKVYGVPAVMIAQINPDPSLAQLIPRELAEKYDILPLKLASKVLHVAAANPIDVKMTQEVEFKTSYDVVFYIAMQYELREKIKVFYGSEIRKLKISDQILNDDQPLQMTTISDYDSKVVGEDLIEKKLDYVLKHLPKEIPKIAPAEAKSRKTVLVVDSDAHIRHALRGALETIGYHVSMASSGRQAIQNIENVRPDVVVLDAILPQVQGYTICQKIKGSEKHQHIPVLLLSSINMGEDFLLDMKERYGAEDIMLKPFRVNDLIAKIDHLMEANLEKSEQYNEKQLALTEKANEWMEKGLAAFGDEDFEKATACFRKGIAIDRFHAKLHYYLGKCQEIAEDFFGSIVSYEKALKLDPQFFAASKDLAILYQSHSFRRKAIDMWEHAIEICPTPTLRKKLKKHLLNLL